MPEVLSHSHIESYINSGYLVLENHLPNTVIKNLRAEIARFEEEYRSLTQSNERIELEEGHNAQSSRIRRIRLPHTISELVCELMFSDAVLASARDLIGPNLRLHTTKLNVKSAERYPSSNSATAARCPHIHL